MLEKVLWQWNKCDGGRLEELAAASMNSAHRGLVSGHSLLAEQQQTGTAVQVSGQPCLGSTLPAPVWGSPYKRWGKEFCSTFYLVDMPQSMGLQKQW